MPSLLDLPSQPALPSPIEPPKAPDSMREVTDTATTRQWIYDNVLQAAKSLPPLTNTRHTLRLKDPFWSGPERYSRKERKRAILEGRTLARRLRGTWELVDNKTGQVLDSKTMTVAAVPALTDDGTFVHNGTEYTLAYQQRMRPGIYTRIKDNGEIEAHANILPDKGIAHRYFLDPEKGVFYMRLRQAKLPLITLLRHLGATDQQLREAWGNELFVSNAQADKPSAIAKYYAGLVRRAKAEEAEDEEARRKRLREALEGMELDPEVMQRTLGKPYNRLGLDVILDTTKKIIRVGRGEEEVDDRDHLSNMEILGPEDLFAERLAKDYGRLRAKLFAANSFRGNLSRMKPGALTPQIESALLKSGLGSALEEINASEVFDKLSRITRMGEGGIPNTDSIPDEARNVQPSHFLFIDPVRTPESAKVGVDLFLGSLVRKGKDRRIYVPVRERKTGKIVYKSPQDLADKAIALPGWEKLGLPKAAVMRKGRIDWVKPDQIDYEPLHFEGAFSPLGNLVPMKSAVKAQRMAMASRMLTQALPLVDPEAPLVQSGVPGSTESFEARYGRYMGAVRADVSGTVVAVDRDRIVVRDSKGGKKTYELYHHFPYNRKTAAHNTPLVQVGDRVRKGDLLARSNYTDEQGVTALGKNARVAYLPFRGLNFEDAVVVSQSFAKRFSSEHIYQNRLTPDNKYKLGRKHYLSLFPGKFDKAQLDKMDEAGVVREGQIVEPGDPIILAAREREAGHHRIWKRKAKSFEDKTVLWNHHAPGVVTDVYKGDKGVTVLVKSVMPLKVGDKLSGRQGDKGIVADIIPDDQMPRDSQGRPFEILLNPLGIISRGNPSQVVEAILGRVAAKRGKPVVVPDFSDIDDLTEWALELARKEGIDDLEKVIDPDTEQAIPAVLTGNRFFMKLHHMAETKGSGRGTGGYTMEGAPAKGGEQGAKRIGMLETNALLSHGAYGVLRDAKLIRGQRNEDFWLAFLQGHQPPDPKVPLVYEKFLGELQASGVNVVPEAGRLNIMAMTDQDVKRLAGSRELQNAETVQWDEGLAPVKGGLFDPTLTGGHNGNRWAKITLTEPMPNPVMEEPIRRILGLTEKQLQDVIAGKEELAGATGPGAIVRALKRIDLDKAIAAARAQIKYGRKTQRDMAVRKLAYLKSAKKMGLHPADWVLKAVPVLPPKFRPISRMTESNTPLVADANYLYKELFEANKNLAEMKKEVSDVGEERLALYQAFKAVTGLADPIHPKLQEKRVRGLLKHIFGRSPKFGSIQRRLLSTTVDVVGRAVIAPDPDLDMDSVAIPEDKAWDVYGDFVARRLVRRGLKISEALRRVKDRTPEAKEALLEELKARPVIISRAPVLHRFGIMAFRPRLTKDPVLKVSPLIVGGFGADFDGNCLEFSTEVPLDIDCDLLYASEQGKTWLSKLEEIMRLKADMLVSVNQPRALHRVEEDEYGRDREVQLQGRVSTVIRIGEFPRIGEPTYDRNGAEVYAVPPGVFVVSYDHATGRIVRAAVRRFTVDRGHRCVEVVSARKRTVTVSDNESLAVFDPESGRLVKKRPEESIGCLMPVAKRYPYYGKKYTSWHLGLWYGMFVCDGWQSTHIIGYAKLDKERRDLFVQIAREEICPDFSAHTYVDDNHRGTKFSNSVKVHLHGAKLRRRILNCYAEGYGEVGGMRSALFKKLPEELLASGSRECLLGLLAGLLEGDRTLGWNTHTKNPRAVCKLHTSSPHLVQDVRQLCRKLGVRLSVTTTPPRNHSRESYTISLSLNDIYDLIAAGDLRFVSKEAKEWAQRFKESPPGPSNIDIVPITRRLAEALASIARAAEKHTLYIALRRAVKQGYVGRYTAQAALRLGPAPDGLQNDWDLLQRLTGNDDVHWDIVKKVTDAGVHDVFDLEVPDTQVFAINNGLVVYDTMNYHVPVSDEAVQEAYERMLPSRNLLSVADFQTPMAKPTQEYVAGLYAATRKRKSPRQKRRKRVHYFADAKSAIAAYHRGDIPIDAEVQILKDE